MLVASVRHEISSKGNILVLRGGMLGYLRWVRGRLMLMISLSGMLGMGRSVLRGRMAWRMILSLMIQFWVGGMN